MSEWPPQLETRRPSEASRTTTLTDAATEVIAAVHAAGADAAGHAADPTHQGSIAAAQQQHQQTAQIAQLVTQVIASGMATAHQTSTSLDQTVMAYRYLRKRRDGRARQ